MVLEAPVNACWLSRTGGGRKTQPAGLLCHTFRVLHALVLAFSLSPTSAFAESAGESEAGNPLLAVQVKGLKQLKPQDVLQASGLTVGRWANPQDFKRAIERLSKTGLFARLAYSYNCPAGGCTLELEVTENEQLVPVEFENLVWFGHDALVALLESRVPLFHGRLPLGGTLPEELVSALHQILEERKISGDVTYVRAAASGSARDSSGSYLFRINQHPVLIRNIEFPGAATAELTALETAARPLAGQPYLLTKVRQQGQSSFLPVYLARGYLKASLSEPQTEVVEDGPPTRVDVRLGVIPGRQYRLSNIHWTGNLAVPVEKLQELIHLKPGEPADAVELREDAERVRKLYGTRGYLFARVDETPGLDDALGTVSYQLQVSEGDLYRMGELTVAGLAPEAARKVVAQWQMKKGAPYDNSYVAKFFNLLYQDEDLKLAYDVQPKASLNPQEKTVSIALHFKPRN